MVVPKRSNLINNLLLNYLKPATCFNLIIAFVYPFCNVVYLGIRFCLHLNPFCNNNASKEYDCKAFTFLPFYLYNVIYNGLYCTSWFSLKEEYKIILLGCRKLIGKFTHALSHFLCPNINSNS